MFDGVHLAADLICSSDLGACLKFADPEVINSAQFACDFVMSRQTTHL